MYWLTGKDKYWHHIVSLSYQESDPLTMLTILTGKAVSIYSNRSLAASDLFPVFTQSVSIHQIVRNEWMLLSAFQQGLRLVG